MAKAFEVLRTAVKNSSRHLKIISEAAQPVAHNVSAALGAMNVEPAARGIVIMRSADKQAGAGVLAALRQSGHQVMPHEVKDAWPTENQVRAISSSLRRIGCTFVVGVGSADSLNLAKAVGQVSNNINVQVTRGEDITFPETSLPTLLWPTTPSSVATSQLSRIVRNDGAIATINPHHQSQQAVVYHDAFAGTVSHKDYWCSLLEGLFLATESVFASDAADRSLAYNSLLRTIVGLAHCPLQPQLSKTVWNSYVHEAHGLLGLLRDARKLGPTDSLATVFADRYSIQYSEAAAVIGGEVHEWLAEALFDKAADEDEEDELPKSAIPKGFVDVARDAITHKFQPEVIAEQITFAANELASHKYSPPKFSGAAMQLNDIVTLLSGLVAEPSLKDSITRGLQRYETFTKTAAFRPPFSSFQMTEADVSGIANAAEVHDSARHFIISPSVKQLTDILRGCQKH